MSSRDKTLNRLRQSVQVGKSERSVIIPDSELYTDFPVSTADLLNLFSERLRQLHGELILAEDMSAAADNLYETIYEFPPNSCLAHAPGILEEMAKLKPAIAGRLADNTMLAADSPAFARITAGITNADYLVARSGSIILSAATAGGRRLSVLPPVHIVLAYISQLVPSLDTALEGLPESSYITIITGPSRTSDIEKKLVLGAHGPKRLVVILIKNSA